MSTQLTAWRGDFGNRYVARNPITPEALEARTAMWSKLLSFLPEPPKSICEVGSNVGINLRAIQLLSPATLYAVEPNALARATLIDDNVVPPENVYANLSDVPGTADLIFTSGVLIHIPPDDLLGFYDLMYRRANRFIINIEYFAQRRTMIPYRNEQDMLWKQDFGAMWLDYFHDVDPIACGFEWSRMTGLDDLTWWIMEKT